MRGERSRAFRGIDDQIPARVSAAVGLYSFPLNALQTKPRRSAFHSGATRVMLHRGYEVWIADSRGQPLPEYQVEVGEDDSVVTCYIPSESGKVRSTYCSQYGLPKLGELPTGILHMLEGPQRTDGEPHEHEDLRRRRACWGKALLPWSFGQA